MSGVDNRIVTMQFNNSEFERNAKTSLSTLQKVKESMNFSSIASGTMKGLSSIGGALAKLGSKTPFAPMIKAANTGLSGVGTIMGRLGLKNPFATATTGATELARGAQYAGGPAGMGVLEGGVTSVSAKFIALSTIAITALSNITTKIFSSATAWAKSFTFQPILDGLNEYQTNLQAIQTVQANTDRPLPEINKALQELNTYSDQTIYNFGQMAKNVGTFTAAGVDLHTSVASIQGIANLAALSGSSSEQAATAMYQLSQAISSGRVGLMDWNSVVNAGMGGKKLQNALAQTAVAMKEIKPSDVQIDKMGKLTIAGKSFRESIMAQPGQESWLSSDILVNTLASLDGRFSKSYQLSLLNADGTKKYTKAQVESNIELARTNLEKKNGVKFTNEQFAALEKMASNATDAAQKVKTLGQVFDIAKETIGSGWSASFQNIFGNLNEAKKLFTGMSNGLNNIIKKNALARNNLLATWKDKGGRTTLIDALTNAWEALLHIAGPIKAAFRDIFPKKTAKDLLSMTKAFERFTERLKPSRDTMHDIRLIARGVFSAFHILWQVVEGVAHGFGTLFDTMGGGKGNFLSFIATIGQNITKFDQWLEKSGVVTAFFEGLGKILAVPLHMLLGVGQAIGDLFSGFNQGDAEGVDGALSNVSKHLNGLQAVGDKVRQFFDKIIDFFSGFGGHIADALLGIGDIVANAFSSENFNKTLDVINTGLLAGILILIKNFFAEGVNIDLTGGLFDGIKETLGSATGAFKNMQESLKANILMKLAIAIGAMALALLVLSGIDPKALSKALGAMAGGFAIIIGAMVVLMKYMGPVGIAQMYVVTSGMTKMSFSILLLSFALKTLSGIKFGDMVRGVVGLAGVMFILTKAMVPLAAGSKGMAKASSSMILMAIAMNLMAVALKIFATMSWEEIVKGLAAMTGSLVALSATLRLIPKDILLQSVALIALATAVNLLAIALKIFATMSWQEMAKGAAMLAGALGAIAIGMRLMPKGILLQSVALVAVAGAMVVLAGALKIFSKMGWEEIGKGLTVLAGAMLILAVGLDAIGVSGTIGAVGLLATAAALVILLPVILALSAMSWEGILKSLTVLAGIFVILGLAGYILAPLTPVIIGLAAALLLIGAGLALAGIGALAFATAFGTIVAAGTAGVQILNSILKAFIASIPSFFAALGEGLGRAALAISQHGPAFTKAMATIISSMLNAINRNIPKFGTMIIKALNTMLRVAVNFAPKLAEAGLTIIEAFLHSIDKHVGDITKTVVSIIAKFITALGNNQHKVLDAGAKFIIKFINGLAKTIDDNHQALIDACQNLGRAIIDAIRDSVVDAGKDLGNAVVDAAKGALDAGKDFLGIGGPSKLFCDELGKPIGEGWAGGIRNSAGLITDEITNVNKKAVNHMANAMWELENTMTIDPNFNPTITPVLDLTAMTKEASKMGSILSARPIVPQVSFAQAVGISDAIEEDRRNRDEDESSKSHVTNVKVEQNNTYPKAPAVGEQYRDTRSLFSLVTSHL